MVERIMPLYGWHDMLYYTYYKKYWTDYDYAWKEILDEIVPQFMLMFFLDVYHDIDWEQGYESLEHELHRIMPDAEACNHWYDEEKFACKNNPFLV